MEPAREAPWAEHEKAHLLAEIIKLSLPSNALLEIIHQHNIQPRWNDIVPPHGRSLRSCQNAFTELNMQPDYRQRHAHLPPFPLQSAGPSDPSKKRALQPEMTPPMGRLIQPRPPHSYPEFVSGSAYTMAPIGEPANKKKRGRPTKEESRARAEAAAARGEIYPAPRRGRPPQTPMAEASPPADAPRPPQPVQPGPPPMGAAATPQQQTQAEEAQSGESSGKKKRNKPTPLELDKPQRELGEMESPAYGQGTGAPSGSQAYSSFTPISAPLRSEESRDRDVRMEGVEESQPRTTTPHSFKDTVGI